MRKINREALFLFGTHKINQMRKKHAVHLFKAAVFFKIQQLFSIIIFNLFQMKVLPIKPEMVTQRAVYGFDVVSVIPDFKFLFFQNAKTILGGKYTLQLCQSKRELHKIGIFKFLPGAGHKLIHYLVVKDKTAAGN